MSKPGPPPTPHALKLLRGSKLTKGKHAAAAKGEPTPAVKAPERPAWLPPAAAAAWDELVREGLALGVLATSDRFALELLAVALADWRELGVILEREGRVYESRNKIGESYHKARPEVAMRARAFDQIRAMLSEFGFSPASRTRVSCNLPQEPDPLDEWIPRGR